jgi:hypothetical protein
MNLYGRRPAHSLILVTVRDEHLRQRDPPAAKRANRGTLPPTVTPAEIYFV